MEIPEGLKSYLVYKHMYVCMYVYIYITGIVIICYDFSSSVYLK
jgi:hypothetical protein